MIQVVSGHQTRFWQDCWMGECPLKVLFPNIFSIALHPDIDVYQAFTEGQWRILFRRQLRGIYGVEWEQLQGMLMEVNLGEGRDKMFWALEQSRKYTSGSLYRAITFGGVRDQRLMNVWKCNIPLKVKIFIWMAAHDRIQSGVQLKKKQWSGPEECAACDNLETTDHILFQCPLAVYLWSFLRVSLSWSASPTNCTDFLMEFAEDCRGAKRKVTLFICAGALWTIWKTRNDMVINKKIVSSPKVIIFKTLMLIKTWRPLLKTKLDPTAHEMINLLDSNLQ
jgi:hypothetical protein